MLENIIVYLFTLFVRGSVDEQSRSPFRRWYSRLFEFRTLLAPNVQFGLFTATLTRAAKHKLFSMLDIDETQILCIERKVRALTVMDLALMSQPGFPVVK